MREIRFKRPILHSLITLLIREERGAEAIALCVTQATFKQPNQGECNDLHPIGKTNVLLTRLQQANQGKNDLHQI